MTNQELVLQYFKGFDEEEVNGILQEYADDKKTTVCSCCRERVSEEDLIVYMDSSGDYYTPPSYSEKCPVCRTIEPLLEKPTLTEWLEIEATDCGISW